MSGFPSLPLDTEGCIADTCYMTNEEAGAHFRLLIFAWQSPEHGVPDDDAKLASMLGITPKKWAKLKPIVMGFWEASEGAWTHRRLKRWRMRIRPKAGSRVPRPSAASFVQMPPANINQAEPMNGRRGAEGGIRPAEER